MRDAHRHEPKPQQNLAQMPNPDVHISEGFLAQHEVLLAFVAIAVYEGALLNRVATDRDVREALESKIQKLKGAQSGLIVESQTVNPYAAAMVDQVEKRIGEVRAREIEANGNTTITDEMLLKVLVFLQRLEYSHNNGRPKCRAFLDFLAGFYAPEAEQRAGVEATADEPIVTL